MRQKDINQIVEVKSRLEFNSRGNIIDRLNNVEKIFQQKLNLEGELDKELIKYVPIATIACFEAFFRSVYAELIDFMYKKSGFSQDLIKLIQKNIKFDLEVISAFDSKALTIGEFVSYQFSCNRLDNIKENISIILGFDFIKGLIDFQPESIFDDVNNNAKQFVENSGEIMTDMNRLFYLRHIFCHEFATNLDIDKNEILKCFNNSKIFLEHTDNYIHNLIYPNALETQTQMNNYADENFEIADKELGELILKIKESFKDDVLYNLDLFDKSILDWKKYRESKAEFAASCVKGGNMYPTLYSSNLKNTTYEKIKSLKSQYNIKNT
jgi:hypothetical protein